MHVEEFEQDQALGQAKQRLDFNAAVGQQIRELVHVPTTQVKIKRSLFYYLNLPFYRLIQSIVDAKTKGTVFYDSVLFAALLFTYPLYLLLWGLGLVWVGVPIWYVTFFILMLPLGVKIQQKIT
jgi:hypothetical protein